MLKGHEILKRTRRHSSDQISDVISSINDLTKFIKETANVTIQYEIKKALKDITAKLKLLDVLSRKDFDSWGSFFRLF